MSGLDRVKRFLDAVDRAAAASDRWDVFSEAQALLDAVGHAAVLLDDLGIAYGDTETKLREIANAVRESESGDVPTV